MQRGRSIASGSGLKGLGGGGRLKLQGEMRAPEGVGRSRGIVWHFSSGVPCCNSSSEGQSEMERKVSGQKGLTGLIQWEELKGAGGSIL